MTSADTPEARRAAARQYVLALPVLQQMVSGIANPELRRAMLREVREDLIEASYVNLLAKHFTLVELEAMVAFYTSAAWRSAAAKMERFTHDVGAAIIPEIDRATKAALGT